MGLWKSRCCQEEEEKSLISNFFSFRSSVRPAAFSFSQDCDFFFWCVSLSPPCLLALDLLVSSRLSSRLSSSGNRKKEEEEEKERAKSDEETEFPFISTLGTGCFKVFHFEFALCCVIYSFSGTELETGQKAFFCWGIL